MKPIFLLLIIFLQYVHTEPQVTNLFSYVREVIGGGEDGEDIFQRVTTMGVACKGKERLQLSANDVEMMTDTGITVYDNVAVILDCGNVTYEADTIKVDHVPVTSGVQSAAASQTVELTDTSLEFMYDRKMRFVDMSEYIEVVEDMKRRRTTIYDRRRSGSEDADLDFACQDGSFMDGVQGGFLAVFGYAGIPRENCANYLASILDNSDNYSSCINYIKSGSSALLTGCIYQMTKAMPSYGDLDAILNTYKQYVDNALNTVYETLESMQASIISLSEAVRINAARLDSLNARQMLIEQEQNNLSNDIIGVMQIQQMQNFAIDSNNANIGMTNAQLIGTGQAMDRNNVALGNALTRLSGQVEMLNVNFNAALEQMATTLATQNSLTMQQMATDITIVIRQLQVQLYAMIEDVSMQNLDSNVQIERTFNTIKSTVNRIGADIVDLRKQNNLIINSLTNITSFELGNQGLAVITHGAMEMRERIGYKNIISEKNPGTKPINVTEYTPMGVIELDLKTHFFASNPNDEAVCTGVINEDWREDMNDFYTKVARADYKVPISSIKHYLRVGDEVLLKYINGSDTYELCTSCGTCNACAGGSRVCFAKGCGAKRSFTVRLYDEFLTNWSNTTSTVNRLLREDDKIVLYSNGFLLYFQDSPEGTCMTTYNEFTEFSGGPGIDYEKAIFTITSPNGPNATFPWIHRDREINLQPNGISEELLWALDNASPNTKCSIGSEEDAILIRLDNTDDTVLRRRSAHSFHSDRSVKREARREKRTPSSPYSKMDFSIYSTTGQVSGMTSASMTSIATVYGGGSFTTALNNCAANNGTLVATSLPTNIRIQLLQNFDLSYDPETDSAPITVPLGTVLSYNDIIETVPGILAMMVMVPRGMRLTISGVRPDIPATVGSCPSGTILENGVSGGGLLDGYDYQSFTYQYHGPQADAAEDFITYMIYGVMNWKLAAGDLTSISFIAGKDPNVSATVMTRCLNKEYSVLKSSGNCPPTGFNKRTIHWVDPTDSMDSLYRNNVINQFAFHNIRYACVDICASPWKYREAPMTLDITTQLDSPSACYYHSTVYKDYFGVTSLQPSCYNADYSSYNPNMGDVVSCNRVVKSDIEDYFIGLPKINEALFASHFRPGADDPSFTEQVQLLMCYPPCDTLTTEQECGGTYSAGCTWNLRESAIDMQCDFTTTMINTLSCPTESDVYDCINMSDKDVWCTWKRSTSECTYYNKLTSNVVQQVVPCERRFDNFESISACVPGIDKVGSDYLSFVADPLYGMAGKGDHCFYRVQPLSLSAECIASKSDNYDLCFKKEVYCDFGFGAPASATPGKDLTPTFYTDFAEERDAYLVSNSYLPVNFTVAQLCAYYDTSDQDECEMKSKNTAGVSQCNFRSSICTPICSVYNNDPEGCINNEPFGNCLYKINTGKCENNIADITTDAACANNNCATIRNSCNIYYLNEANCVNDPNNACTWLYSSEDANYTAHCIRKIEVGISACYNESSPTANDYCDLKDIGNGELITNALKAQCSFSTVPAECVQDIDAETGKHCVSIVIASRTYRCKPPGDASINNIVNTYSGNLDVQLYYYTNYTDSNLIHYLVYENITFEELHTDILRQDSLGSPSTYSAVSFGKHGITLVPDRAESLFSRPCTDAGMNVVGKMCCHANDTIEVVDETGDVTHQCLFNSTTSFYNPQHPANLYITTSIDLCDHENLDYLANPRRVRFPVYYVCRVFTYENIEEQPECALGIGAEAIENGDFVCHPYIEYEACMATKLCDRFVAPICMIDIKLKNDVVGKAVRLDNDVLSMLSFSKTYYLYDNSEFVLDDMTEVYGRWQGKNNDLYPSNATVDTPHTLMGKFDKDIRLIIDSYTSFYGKNPRSWKATLGDGVVPSRTNNEFSNGKLHLKTDYTHFGFVSQTRPHPFIDDIEETGEVPVYLLKNMRQRTTAKLFLYINNTLVQTIEATNEVASDPYVNTLPIPDVTRFIHEVIPDRGIVVSPPFSEINVITHECHKIGYYRSYSATNKTISYEDYMKNNQNYDPLCMDGSVSNFASSIDRVTYNTTGYDWCGEEYATIFEYADTLESIINIRYLNQFYLTDPDGNLLGQWWNNTFNNETFDAEEFISFSEAIERKWLDEGCRFDFLNYVDTSDAILSLEGSEDYYYIFDKLRIFYSEFLALGDIDFDDKIDIISQALIEPIVAAKNDRNCGNCGGFYGTNCKTQFFGKARGTVSTMSARHGLCVASRYYDINWDKETNRISFVSREGLSSIAATFDVNFPEVTQTILGGGCPIIANPPSCDDVQARCTITLKNPSSEGNLILRGEVTSENCGGNRTISIPPNSSQQFESLLCQGTMTLNLYSFNGTLCLSATRTFNYTETYGSIFQPIMVNAVTEAKNEIIQSTIDLIDYRLQNVTNIVDLIGDVSIVTSNLTERIGKLEDITDILDGEIRNELNLIQANSSLQFDIIRVRFDDVSININNTIDRIGTVETIVADLKNATDSLIENREDDQAELHEKLNNNTLKDDKLREDFNEAIDETNDKIQDTEGKLDELKNDLDVLKNFTFNFTGGSGGSGGGGGSASGTSSALAITATALAAVALVGVIGVTIYMAVSQSSRVNKNFHRIGTRQNKNSSCNIL